MVLGLSSTERNLISVVCSEYLKSLRSHFPGISLKKQLDIHLPLFLLFQDLIRKKDTIKVVYFM